MKDEILCFLPNSDEPVTAKRLTAQIFPPYSASKSVEVSKILEVLLSEGKVANCRLPGVNSIGWYLLDDLELNSRKKIDTIYKVLHSIRNNGNDISFYLKREMLRCIRSSAYPITHRKILDNLVYLDIFFNTAKPFSYLRELELENKIIKVNVDSSILPAWRAFDPLFDKTTEVATDTTVKVATDKTNTPESRALKKGFCLSDDNKTLYISIFSIVRKDYANLKKIIKSHTGDCVIIDFPNNRKKFVLDDMQAFILSQDKSEKYLSYLEEFLEKFPSTPGHLKLARLIARSRRQDRYILLESLTEISDEVAVIFSKFNGGLILPRIKKISDCAADALSNLKNPVPWISETKWRDLYLEGYLNLELSGLEELSDSVGHIKLAKKLAHQDTLTLPRLVKVSPQAAAALALHQGPLQLEDMKKISNESAEQLSRCTGDLIMPAVEGLSDTEGHINLGVKLLKQEYDDNGDVKQDLDKDENEDDSFCSVSKIFKKITPSLLKNSFISNLNIYLKDSTIEEQLADALCAHRGKIQLSGLEELTEYKYHVNLSQRLAIQETVYLKKLKKLSLSSAAALSEALELYLDGLQQIDERLASVLSKNIGILSLNGITMLSNDSAMELANHTGFLFLNGLSSLTDSRGHLALAKKLSRQDSIELKNLKSLSSEAADLFCNCPGDILLPYKNLGKSPEHLQLRIKISKQSFLIP